MKKSVSLLFIAALLTACSSTSKIESNKQINKVSNSSNIDLSKIKHDLDDNRVFLAGEMHGIKENYTLRLNLLMYLNEHSGVNYYLAEMGYSSGYFINKYLESGDEKFLYIVVNSIIGSYDHSQDDLNFWKNLYKYNQSIPKENRIKVIGLDIEHQFWLSIMQITLILEDLNLGSEMETTLGKLEYYSSSLCPNINDSSDILKNVKKLNIKEILESISKVREDYELFPNKYSELMSEEELKGFNFLISCINETERIYSNKNNKDYFNKEREKAIYSNFQKAYAIHPEGKFFGQWGSFHIMQQRDNDETRFAEYLNSNTSPVKDQVVSIKYIYDNKRHKRYNKAILEAFKKYSDSKFTLYDLESFNPQNQTAPVNEHGIDDLTEFFQYGILVRDPRKVDPLKM